MASGLRIRRAVVSEAGELTGLAMRSKAFWGYDQQFMAMCLEELTVEGAAIEAGEVWVAEQEESIVGLLELVAKEQAMEIRLIFVEPGRVRSGIGSALWRHAEARARKLGALALGLDADPNALGFYQRMGTRVVGSSPSGSIPGRTLPRMAKSLAADTPERTPAMQG